MPIYMGLLCTERGMVISMLIFTAVIIILIISDLLDFKKVKSRRVYIVYFTLIALTLTGAVFYYANPGAPSFAAVILRVYGKN